MTECRGAGSILKEAYSEAIPRSAICVQNFDDSLSFAIRITYRISLRSSSLRGPRYPLLKVVHYIVSLFEVTSRNIKQLRLVILNSYN